MTPLEKYKSKRRFSETAEPKGNGKPNRAGHALRFVIQKHAASREHYDLRLEVDGVLKSWAMPKGPSLNPIDKHLAVMVEDHPFEYKDFEGVIPKDNYGAGTVMIWDEGYYRPLGLFGQNGFDEAQENGHIVFALAGKKLNGEFALIKLKRGSKNDWILVKARDWYAAAKDIQTEDRSARSGRSMDEIRQAARKLPRFNPKSPKSEMPSLVKPMLATLVEKPFTEKGWAFEIKWDGYRAITEVQGGVANLFSRNGKSFNEKFGPIRQAFENYSKDVILDGEIVVLDSAGRSSFQLLQQYIKTGNGILIYFVFDVLYYDGHDLTSEPWNVRRKLLAKLLPDSSNVMLSEDVKTKGEAFFEAARAKDLEGIIAKRMSSTYQVGKRSRDWLKIKNHLQQEAIICGFTKPRGSRSGFGSLLLGVYDKGLLTYIGNVGTGFDETGIKELMKIMKPLVTDEPTFDLKNNDGIVWVQPKLVCEVRFQEWTQDGSLRQPVFLGLREDKKPKDVHKEVASG